LGNLFIIGFGIVVSLTGMFTLGGEEQHDPLKGVLIFTAAGTGIKDIHETTVWVLLALTGIHAAGVVVESFLHRENLVLAMITGYKFGKKGGAADAPYGIVAVVMVMIVIGLGFIYFKGYLAAAPDKPFVPFQGPALPDNATWRKACGECHLAYHPTTTSRSAAAPGQGQPRSEILQQMPGLPHPRRARFFQRKRDRHTGAWQMGLI
jgi:hypothetical protein